MSTHRISKFKMALTTHFVNATKLPNQNLTSKILIITFISSLLYSCQSNIPTFDSFDSSSWKSDATDCNGYRNSVINEMEAEFDKFLGLNETELVSILGTPTKTLLYTRGQKFFSYKINCGENNSNSLSLRIRFSALDLVNEVLILE